ncbi:bifunctional methylenetetrahydrofolate dehydrogenase/methenyltetrahydrofolate cyclohydrolase, partial [bacterium]|nr:bifunctional methylenetetrahydrofolate dehydrogenase/methenyltetrahydrofolate cyclohydrolase [bacterium]
MNKKTKIVDGLAIAKQIKKKLKLEIIKNKLSPSLAVILIGNDSASQIYVNLKE